MAFNPSALYHNRHFGGGGGGGGNRNSLYNSIIQTAQNLQQKYTKTDSTLLYQKDFNVPIEIDQPGIYKLMENINLKFYPNKDDIYDVATTEADLFGFAAGIKISSHDVVLDLNGFTIAQSPQDFCVQRFFAIIQLNNSPFRINSGPIPHVRTKLEKANRCVIKNGTLGLSSHQAILGNDNTNIILENLTIRDFEVTGITLNNVNTVYLNNIRIQSSIGVTKPLPVSPYFSTLIFNLRLLKLLLNYSGTTEQNKSLIVKTFQNIEKNLDPFFSAIYSSGNLNSIYSNFSLLANRYRDLKFLFNMSKFSPCAIQGIKITGPTPGISAFHQSTQDDAKGEKSTNIYINNCTFQDLVAKVNPTVCVTHGKKLIHVGAGLKLTAELLDKPMIQDLVVTMNSLKQNTSLKRFLSPGPPSKTATPVNNDVIEHMKVGRNSSKKMGFDKSHDMMGHVGKGVLAVRIGCSANVTLKNITISNIQNIGERIKKNVEYNLNRRYNIEKMDETPDTFLTPLSSHGSYAMGIIFSGVKNCIMENCIIKRIQAPDGAAVGLAVNNICTRFNINNVDISNLSSCKDCFDSAIFVVDEQSSHITTNNLTLNPSST